MSLQHRNLAQVWEHLQGRHDIANLLREIVGQHAIASHDTESRSIEESIRTIGWIKIVFDFQRCYLSGIATGVADCPPYVLSCLLPPDLLFSTILYLISIKTSLFSSQTTLMTREFTRPRYILAQTILSGLRLLLLQKEGINANDQRRLQNAINQAWREDRLHGVERFIVCELFAEILNALSEPSRENPYAREWANAKLPAYAAGLVSESDLVLCHWLPRWEKGLQILSGRTFCLSDICHMQHIGHSRDLRMCSVALYHMFQILNRQLMMSAIALCLSLTPIVPAGYQG
jgi:hypothetical protein